MNAEKTLSQSIFGDAAFLAREFRGRSYYGNKNNTIYVYDTDVIISYCAPWLTGPGRDQNGNGYGEPISFRSPEDINYKIDALRRRNRATAVAFILAEHALRLSGTFPVYQLSPQYHETQGVYETVRRKASAAGDLSRVAMEDRKTRQVISASAIINARQTGMLEERDISKEVDALLFLLSKSPFEPFTSSKEQNAIREWDNFVELNKVVGGVYSSSEVAKHFSEEGLPDVSEVLENTDTKYRTEGFGGRLEALRDGFLAEVKLISQSGAAIESNQHRDAEVLALLALYNEQLMKVGWRMVLVTGSKVLSGASFHRPNASMRKAAPHALENFSEKYVRHLWAYTSDALIEPSDQIKFINWLEGLFGRYASATELPLEKLHALVKNPPKGQVPADEWVQAFKFWSETTRKATNNYAFRDLDGFDESLRDRLVARIQRSREQNLDWSTIVATLSEDVDQTKDRTFLHLSNIGTQSLIRAKESSRHPPDLNFESLVNTQRIFQTLCSKDGYPTVQSFEIDFNKIVEDCFESEVDNRQLCHLQYLALGAAFASASKWSIALSQAQRAIRVIKRSRTLGGSYWPIPTSANRNSFMSGREAFFLAAVAFRHIAKSKKDFVTSQDYLNDCEEALKEDHAHGTSLNYDTLKITNEKCALPLSEYYLERSETPDDPCDMAFQKVEQSFEDLMAEVDYLADPPALSRRKKTTLVHLAVNTLQVCTIRGYRGSKRPEGPELSRDDKNLVQRAVNLIESLTEAGGKHNARLFQTKLMKCYRLVALLLLGNSKGLGEREIEEAFHNWRESVVTPYDEWRYDSLKEFSLSLIERKN